VKTILSKGENYFNIFKPYFLFLKIVKKDEFVTSTMPLGGE